MSLNAAGRLLKTVTNSLTCHNNFVTDKINFPVFT